MSVITHRQLLEFLTAFACMHGLGINLAILSEFS